MFDSICSADISTSVKFGRLTLFCPTP